MNYQPKEFAVKSGNCCLVRSARSSDHAEVTEYRIKTADETRFLSRSGSEIHISDEEEKACLQEYLDSDNSVFLNAYVKADSASDDAYQLAGCCWISPISNRKRHTHRCELAIALYQDYCNLGIGSLLIREVLAAAKSMGYEQMELEVSADNRRAIAAYQALGFRTCGFEYHSMKFEDGTYADGYHMILML